MNVVLEKPLYEVLEELIFNYKKEEKEIKYIELTRAEFFQLKKELNILNSSKFTLHPDVEYHARQELRMNQHEKTFSGLFFCGVKILVRGY